MKVSELFEAADAMQEITVKNLTDDTFVVNTKAKSGMTLDAIYVVYSAFVDTSGNALKGVTLKSKAGLTLDFHRMFKNRPNGFVLRFEKPEGALEKIQAAIEKAKTSVEKDVKAKAKHKAEAPQRKKEASKMDAVYRKADKAERDNKYGKGTWERITFKQEGGDDGYQYVLRLDGRAVMNGLTRSAAEGEKHILARKIAKQEELGEFADKD